MSDTQTISVSFIKKIWATDDLDDDGLRWGIYITKDSGNKRVVIKGKLNDELATPGSQFNVIGKWIVDPKYGQQFEFGTYARCLPFGEYGTKAFLRRADNIGSVAADEIYSMYGDNSINVVINHPDKVIAECDLKPHVVNEAAVKFRAERDGIETLLPLITLFGDTKIPDKTAHKIISMGWKDAVSSIKKNPFKLMKIPNIGFKKCDSLRIKLKLPPEDPERIQAACLQVFKDSSDQAWLKPDQLKSAMQEMLEIPDVRIDNCVESLIVDGMITARWSGRAGSEYVMQTWYGLKKHYEEEIYISKRMFESMSDETCNWPIESIESDMFLSRHQKDVIIHNMEKSGRIMLLTGSPGVGKTASLAKIIKAFTSRGQVFYASAPTGKAAQRLTETLSSHGVHGQATTIHRMLEPKPLENGEFKFGLQGQDDLSFVDADVIAVDEMSMCNNNLAYHMLKGIRPDTYVILVGDRNQLPPIGPGTFLRDFQELGYKELTEIQRNAGGIVKTCAAIRDGHPITLPHTRNPGINVTPDTNAQIVTTPKKDSAKRIKIEKFLQSLVDGKVENVTDPMEDVQFITATHNNDQVGRNALNKMIQGMLNPNGRGGHAHYKFGDKIICTKNSQLKNSDNDPQFVANGELGYVTLSEPKYIKARMNNNPASEITIPCGPDLGGGWDLGFCITCHKSQGSEWPVVVIVIGSDYGTELVTSREWIYTALSRAKSCSIVISSPAQLQEMYKKIKIWDRKSFILENIRNLQHENSQVSVDAAN